MGGGREAGEVEVEAAEEGFGGGVVDGVEVVFFEGGEEVVVDGVAGPGGVLDFGGAGGGGGLGEGLEGPEGVGGLGLGFGFGDGGGGAGVGGAVGDPLAEGFDLVGGEFLLGGHFEVAVVVGDGAEESAGVG